MHVAARVSATAGAGQVFISQAVVDELGSPVGEPLGTYDLKDIAEPVTLWRVTGDSAPPRATPTRRTNVAEARTSFVGREAELAELTAALQQPGLVTVAGPGGLGKTRLVSELALRQADTLPAGAWLVELAPVPDGDGVSARVAEVLGLRGNIDAAALVEELRRRGHVLLVLDNCEHVVEASADLAAALLDGCPDLRLLCTSREPLAVHGERVLRLAHLPTGDHGVEGAAEALFLSRAEAAGAVVRPADLAAVTEVCRHLDGLPLALELAAARTATLPVADLVAALAAGDVDLARRGGDARQRSLDALVEWSVRLLDDGERTALLGLSVFPGRFSTAMADAVLRGLPGARAGAAGQLTRRSLVDLDGDHYRMLTTTRDVVRRALGAQPDVHDAAMNSLLTWARERAKDPDALVTLTPDEVHALQVALEWAVQRDLPGGGLVMDRLARWELTRNRTATSLELAAQVLTRPDPTTVDEVLLQVAAIRLIEGLASTQTVPIERIAAIADTARRLGDPEAHAKAVRMLAGMLDRTGRHEDAVPLLREVLALGDEHPEVDESLSLIDLGVSFHLHGDLEEAEWHYRRAVELIGPHDVNHGLVLSNLGEVLLDSDRPDDAAEALRRALREAVGRPNLSAWATGLLVEAEARRGNEAVARALGVQAEAELGPVIEDDPSIAYVRARMRAALAALDQAAVLP